MSADAHMRYPSAHMRYPSRHTHRMPTTTTSCHGCWQLACSSAHIGPPPVSPVSQASDHPSSILFPPMKAVTFLSPKNICANGFGKKNVLADQGGSTQIISIGMGVSYQGYSPGSAGFPQTILLATMQQCRCPLCATTKEVVEMLV